MGCVGVLPGEQLREKGSSVQRQHLNIFSGKNNPGKGIGSAGCRSANSGKAQKAGNGVYVGQSWKKKMKREI
jgi:hypothetical protein